METLAQIQKSPIFMAEISTLDNFVTIKTFTYPIDLAVIRGRLEAEGIDCFAKDELVAQANPFLSNAIGGIKLQVRQRDLPRAIEILEEGGYLKESDFRPTPLFTKLDNATFKLPFLRGLPMELRVLVIVGVSLFVILVVCYFALLPTPKERLEKGSWCVDNITYYGKDFVPSTSSKWRVAMNGSHGCEESISFTNGVIFLPGFKTSGVGADCKIYGQTVSISQADNFGYLYNGAYEIAFKNNTLVLKSPSTVIYCHTESR